MLWSALFLGTIAYAVRNVLWPDYDTTPPNDEDD